MGSKTFKSNKNPREKEKKRESIVHTLSMESYQNKIILSRSDED